MYKLTNLDESIKTLSEQNIADIGGKGEITYRKALVSSLEMHRPKPTGDGEGLKAFDLGIKIQKAADSLLLKEEDMKFLKEVIASSTIFLSVVIGRLIHYLEEIKESHNGESVPDNDKSKIVK